MESGMKKHEKINYVEFPAKNIEKSKTFIDYGPEYTAFV